MLELKLYEPIGGFFGLTAKEFTEQIPEGETDITVRINSPGGDVSEGLAIYNYLKGLAANVTTIVDGYAASSASLVMMAGDRREAHKASFVMIHNPWSMAMGESDEMRHTADVLDEHRDAIIDVYADVTGKSASDLREMMDDETWMRGEAALENGFATHVVDDSEGQAAAAARAWGVVFNAIRNGKELNMSKQQTRKEIEAERDQLASDLEAAQARVGGIDAQIDAATQDVREELVGELDTARAELLETRQSLETANASVDALTTENVEIQGKTVELTERMEALLMDHAEMQAKLDEEAAKVTALESKLRDPAYVDAALQTSDDQIDAVQAQADAEADDAEAKAAEEVKAQAEAEKPSWDKYDAIEDAGERRAYYLKHRDVLKAQANENEEEG